MDSQTTYWAAKAALDWQIEMGADEAICDMPIDRYALSPTQKAHSAPRSANSVNKSAQEEDTGLVARKVANSAANLSELRHALEQFEHCDLRASARNCLFSTGTAKASIMIIVDAPDRVDDRAGQLFVDAKGNLLKKMFAAIDLNIAEDVYFAPIVPWNPPQDRDVTADEHIMMRPFLERHINLAAPRILVLMGNGPCQMLLGRSGVSRLRGQWCDVHGLPALPMLSPAYLLGTPSAKREAWTDLLALKSKLRDLN